MRQALRLQRQPVGTGAYKRLSALSDTKRQQFLCLLPLEPTKLIDCEGGKRDGAGPVVWRFACENDPFGDRHGRGFQQPLETTDRELAEGL